jgi:phage tail-like protein
VAATRPFPYSAFNFSVSVDGRQAFGGFQEVNGLMTDIKVSEYRTGVDPENHVRKVPGMHAVGDITLKRGIVSSKDLWDWIDTVRRTGPAGKRTVVVTLNDESGRRVQSWQLQGALPLKYTGPTFAAKAGTDVATEELVLSVESLVLQQP